MKTMDRGEEQGHKGVARLTWFSTITDREEWKEPWESYSPNVVKDED